MKRKRKIHVITQKEAVSESKLTGCTAVVLDVFLATSTIAFLLKHQYDPVYTAEDSMSALLLASKQSGSYLLLGESKGEGIEGFQYPDPCLIEPAGQGQAAIICSTNGTRAIEKARHAKTLYLSSLVNGHLIADRLHNQEEDSSIVLICSGNDDRFSLEDFIGAGQIVEHLTAKGSYQLSDAAMLSRDTYRNSRSVSFQNLMECETAALLRSVGFAESIELVIQNHEQVDVIPVFTVSGIIDDYVSAKKAK